MSYERTPQGQKLAQNALTKIVVYFVDGNSRKFFSRDYLRGHKDPNKELGITRLKKMVAGWIGRVDKAVIYDNTTEEEITKYKNGHWI